METLSAGAWWAGGGVQDAGGIVSFHLLGPASPRDGQDWRFQGEVVLNSKSDFQQAPLVRLVATTGLLEEQSLSQEAGVRQWQDPGEGARSGSMRGRGGRREEGRGRGSGD